MAGMKVKIGADTSVLGKGIRRAKGMIGGLGKAVKAAGVAGLAVAAAGAAAAMAGLAISIRGVNGALKLGSRLSDVAANTGMLAGQVAVLERAFEDAGISGEKVQGTITKMQRGIVEAGEGVLTYKRAFDALGLSLDDLRKMSPAEQFQAIQNALAGMSDPAERSARAMQIFGRSGADLGALFSNKGALGNAAESVGEQADILNKNADAFDRSADLLAGMGAKLQGFFVGLADFINPVLLPVLEQMNKIDLAAYGQAAGRFIATIAEAFKQGALGSLAADALVFGAKKMINSLWTGFKTLVVFFGTTFAQAVETAWSKVTDMTFWKGVLEIFKSVGTYLEAAAYKIAASVHGGDFHTAGDSLLSLANTQRERAMSKINAAGDGKSIADVLRHGMETAAQFYRNDEDALDTRPELRRMTETMRRLGEVVDEKNKQEEKTKKPKRGTVLGAGDLSAGVRAPSAAPRVQSLARVGGAVALRGVDLARERNGLLKRIENNTRGRMAAVYA